MRGSNSIQEQRPNIFRDQHCTFCQSVVKPTSGGGQLVQVTCPCCGTFRITASAIDSIVHWVLEPHEWIAVAYALRKMTNRAEPPRLDTYVLSDLREVARLPHPDQILDDFVLWMGSHARWPGEGTDVTWASCHVLLGAVDQTAFNYMVEWLLATRWLTGVHSQPVSEAHGILNCALTPQGWERFRALSNYQELARDGFMAMQFGDPELDTVFRDHFVPEVQRAGFALRRLDDGQPAGLIDDQLRVRIRIARFLVCDLTHGNAGAYWEAGYAEGLGKPVIYSCRKDVFEDKNHACHPHFDTNHLVTIIWDPADAQLAAVKLKATVRATLPAEARLAD